MGRKKGMHACKPKAEKKFRLRVLGKNDTWEWRYFPTFGKALNYAKSISYEDDELPVIYRKQGRGWVAIPGWEDRYKEAPKM